MKALLINIVICLKLLVVIAVCLGALANFIGQKDDSPAISIACKEQGE